MFTSLKALFRASRLAAMIGSVLLAAAVVGATAGNAQANDKAGVQEICELEGGHYWEDDGGYGCTYDSGDGCVFDTAEPGGKAGNNGSADGPTTAFACYNDGELSLYGVIVEVRSGSRRTFDPANTLRLFNGLHPPRHR
jgi:hypothetical protein